MPTLNRHRDNTPKRQGRANREIYNSHRWQKLSKQRLKKHRLCVHCLKEGIITAARVTDHIIPITQGGDIWADSNHQSLCIPCHNRKTAKENNLGKLNLSILPWH